MEKLKFTRRKNKYKGKTAMIRVNHQTHDRIGKMCEETGLSMLELTEILINFAIENSEIE